MFTRALTALVVTSLALSGLTAPASAAETEYAKVKQRVEAQLRGKALDQRRVKRCTDAFGGSTPALAPIEWMAGEWLGTGWTATEAGVATYIQTEDVRPVAGRDELTVNGTGYEPVRGADVVFSAHAVATREADGSFSWVAESGGNKLVTTLEVADGFWAWEVVYAPGVVMRYETTAKRGGRVWHETGAITTNGGKTWIPTMEMTLIKTCDA